MRVSRSRTALTPLIQELGAGIGLASIAAARLGCRVFATDGSPTSVGLLEDNFRTNLPDEGGDGGPTTIRPRASMLEWGDLDSADGLVRKDILSLPDVIMASDVVYLRSARRELADTIRRLCPDGHLRGRVVVAHRWRTDTMTDTADEASFFEEFDGEFDREEVAAELLPEGYNTRAGDVSVFVMKRKH